MATSPNQLQHVSEFALTPEELAKKTEQAQKTFAQPEIVEPDAEDLMLEEYNRTFVEINFANQVDYLAQKAARCAEIGLYTTGITLEAPLWTRPAIHYLGDAIIDYFRASGFNACNPDQKDRIVLFKKYYDPLLKDVITVAVKRIELNWQDDCPQIIKQPLDSDCPRY